ncbi:hypothetical protein VTJ83DRAFT_2612 [Remersonia thermophila]|uniref:Secreted protein n=1 Tax=Remersonia thermophila TaxID=72144 RepID=A0ABR4DJ78_9PEZI
MFPLVYFAHFLSNLLLLSAFQHAGSLTPLTLGSQVREKNPIHRHLSRWTFYGLAASQTKAIAGLLCFPAHPRHCHLQHLQEHKPSQSLKLSPVPKLGQPRPRLPWLPEAPPLSLFPRTFPLPPNCCFHRAPSNQRNSSALLSHPCSRILAFTSNRQCPTLNE